LGAQNSFVGSSDFVRNCFRREDSGYLDDFGSPVKIIPEGLPANNESLVTHVVGRRMKKHEYGLEIVEQGQRELSSHVVDMDQRNGVVLLETFFFVLNI
jgi:hypothetical protein